MSAYCRCCFSNQLLGSCKTKSFQYPSHSHDVHGAYTIDVSTCTSLVLTHSPSHTSSMVSIQAPSKLKVHPQALSACARPIFRIPQWEMPQTPRKIWTRSFLLKMSNQRLRLSSSTYHLSFCTGESTARDGDIEHNMLDGGTGDRGTAPDSRNRRYEFDTVNRTNETW